MYLKIWASKTKERETKSSDSLTSNDGPKTIKLTESSPFFLSLSVCLYFWITLREEDKNIFDYCRENNIDHISKAISSQKVDVNTKDEEVTTKRGASNYVKWNCTDGTWELPLIVLLYMNILLPSYLTCALARHWVCTICRVVAMCSDPSCRRAGENDQWSIMENPGHWGMVYAALFAVT